MNNFLVVKVLQSLENLLGVVGDRPLVPLQRSPLGPQEGAERASGHLFHDDLEVTVLRERTVVLDNVLVPELAVQLDFLVQGLDVAEVLLRDLLDGHPDLGVEVAGGVDDAVGAAAEDRLAAAVVEVILELGIQKTLVG